MGTKLSRRELLKSAAGASCVALTGMPAHADPLAEAMPVTDSSGILPLTSTSEVFIPPRGASFMKFSYDFPEPAVEFAGLRFSFRLHTFENTYGLDRDSMKVESTSDGIEVTCTKAGLGGRTTHSSRDAARTFSPKWRTCRMERCGRDGAADQIASDDCSGRPSREDFGGRNCLL